MYLVFVVFRRYIPIVGETPPFTSTRLDTSPEPSTRSSWEFNTSTLDPWFLDDLMV
jgi:hypothetical protein